MSLGNPTRRWGAPQNGGTVDEGDGGESNESEIHRLEHGCEFENERPGEKKSGGLRE